MLKKVWFMLVLCSVLMVSGCSGGMQKENADSMVISEVMISEPDVEEELESDVSLEADADAIRNSITSVEAEQTQTSDTEKQTPPSTEALGMMIKKNKLLMKY